MTGKLPRWIAAALAGVLAAGAIAAPAWAHVHVDVEGDATAGQPAQLVFEVPNERDDSATVSIEVQMSREADLTDVVPAAVEGWTITTTLRDDDVVDTIRWDAIGPGLVADASAALPVDVGPLPAVESLTFPTVQTYDDGEVVRWIEPAVAGQPEPELPVAALAIAFGRPGATTAPTEPAVTDAPAPTEPTTPTEPTAPTEPVATPSADSTTPSATLVIAPAPTGTADAATTEVTGAPPTVDTDEDDGPVWPWVMVVIVIVVVGGGIAVAIARRRASG